MRLHFAMATCLTAILSFVSMLTSNCTVLVYFILSVAFFTPPPSPVQSLQIPPDPLRFPCSILSLPPPGSGLAICLAQFILNLTYNYKSSVLDILTARTLCKYQNIAINVAIFHNFAINCNFLTFLHYNCNHL